MPAFYFHGLVLGALIALSVFSCAKQEEIPETIHFVHEDFQDAVDTFAHYAKLFGVAINMDNLVIDYADDLEFGICGICSSQRPEFEGQREIRIVQNQSCWSYYQELEALILHELGHCLLSRTHVMDTLANGDPKSLMVSADLSLFAPCIYSFGDVEDCNNLYKRTYYIAELFNPEISAPSWSFD